MLCDHTHGLLSCPFGIVNLYGAGGMYILGSSSPAVIRGFAFRHLKELNMIKPYSPKSVKLFFYIIFSHPIPL